MLSYSSSFQIKRDDRHGKALATLWYIADKVVKKDWKFVAQQYVTVHERYTPQYTQCQSDKSTTIWKVNIAIWYAAVTVVAGSCWHT